MFVPRVYELLSRTSKRPPPSVQRLLEGQKQRKCILFLSCAHALFSLGTNRVRHNVFAVALWLFFGVSRRSARSKNGRQQQVGTDSSPLPSRFVLSRVEEVLTEKSSFAPTARVSRLAYMSQASSELPTSSPEKQRAAVVVLNGFEPDGLGENSPSHEPQSEPPYLSCRNGAQVDERYAVAPPQGQKGRLSRVVFWQGRRFTYSPRTESFLLSKSELPPVSETIAEEANR